MTELALSVVSQNRANSTVSTVTGVSLKNDTLEGEYQCVQCRADLRKIPHYEFCDVRKKLKNIGVSKV